MWITYSMSKETLREYWCYWCSLWHGRMKDGYNTLENGETIYYISNLLFKNIVFYTPLGEDFFAIEPVTNCNNGFNMAEQGIQDTGTLYLKPGEEVSGEIRLKVDSIY